MDQIKNILKFAMRMEKDAGDFYKYYMDKVQSEDTKKLFSELAETEDKHYNILKEEYDKLGFNEPPITISWVVDNNFAAKDPHILSSNSDFINKSEADSADLSIIRMAYLIESDFAEFYNNAIENVEDNESKELLRTLSKWENEHKAMFQERYQALLKKYWGDISSIIFAK